MGETVAFFAVLLAALLHATWNALIKTSGDRLVTMALLGLAAAVPAVIALPFVPPLPRAAWGLLGLSIIVHSAYKAFLLKAYEHGDLSKAYPIARGSAPLLVAMGSYLLMGERLPALGYAGVGLISAGILMMAAERSGDGLPQGRALFYALSTGVLVAAYSTIDALGVRAGAAPGEGMPVAATAFSGGALGYVVWLFLLDGIVYPVIATLRRGRRVVGLVRAQGPRDAFAGMLAFAGYTIVLLAFAIAPAAQVVALRETSVVIAALIGTLLLGEAFGRTRIAAAILVAAGVALLRFGG